MRDIVVYIGGFVLPNHSASALRALGNAVVLRDIGYRVLIAGKFARWAASPGQPILVEGFECRDIRQPLPGLRVVDYTRDLANVDALLRDLGEDRIAAVIAYNYPHPGLARLISLCRDREIPVVNESTEWYGWEGFRPVTNVRRILGSWARNNHLARRAGNFICSTYWSQARHPETNSLVLPFALDPAWEVWQVPANDGWCDRINATRIVYSGSPGIGMYKDRLPWILEALGELTAQNLNFCFAIVGITADQYMRSVPRHAPLLERLGNCVVFLGKLPHEEAVAILKSADFSVFVRRRNRVSTVGFPTKFAEAITCGVPVVTNDTSDIARYLKDGVNGILIDGFDAAQIRAGLKRALSLPTESLHRMKQNVVQDSNPFAVEVWVERMREFMSKLRLPK